MKIGVIGSGNMGGGLGALWAHAGHEVLFSYSRDPERLSRLAATAGNGAQAGSTEEAARFGEIIFVAVPWSALEDALRPVAAELVGKVLLTCVSPLVPNFTGQTTGIASPLPDSGAEHIAVNLAPGARVVESFNLTFAEVLAGGSGRFGSGEVNRATVPYVGDDAEAKRLTAVLIADAGYDPLDAGPLIRARVLEPLATAWVQFAAATGIFPGTGLRILRRHD